MKFVKILLAITILLELPFITNRIFAQSLPDENSHFGIFGVYATEYPYFQNRMGFNDTQYWKWARENLADLGTHWTRCNNQLIWDFIEPVLDSTYNWNPDPFKTDSVIINTYYKDYPVHWLGVFHVGGLFGQKPNRPPLRNPLSDTLRYLRFVQSAVERYDGGGIDDVHPDVRVKYWQLGNEIPGNATIEQRENYIQWVKLMVDAIHHADSTAKIALIASTQGFFLDPWLKDVIQELSDNHYFDIVDIHHWKSADKYQMEAVRQTRQLLDNLGLYNVEIWSCENGTWAYQPQNQPYQTQEEQARSLIKRYVYNLDLGLDKLFWNNLMEWKDFAGNPGSIYNSMGLISDGQCNGEPPASFNQPRIAYFTYKLLAETIDTKFSRYLGTMNVHQPPKLFAYHYQSLKEDSLNYFILWRDAGTQRVSFVINTPRAYVINIITDSMGRFHEKYFLNADNENKITLEVGINPVLVQEISSADFYQTECVEVWVQNLGTESDNGNKIFTRIHQPVPSIYPNERFPAVVVVPGGLGPGAMDHDYLAESGFVVVHFNAEGRVGNHPDDKQSQGSENFNGKIHQDDLKAIIDYVLSLPNVQTDNVGIFSNSFGITMAAGCLGRYPDLPVKYLLDNEGPSDSRVTCFDYWNDPNRTQKAYDIFGHYSTALDSSADNVAWWSEREAIHYIGKFNGYYLRIQSEFDHAQPPWFHDHAIDMINEATSTKYGGNGNCIWTRVNGSENAINTVYDQNNPPIWFSEQVERQMKAMEYIIELANMTPLTKVVNKDMNNLPKNLQLNQNFPNPFNASTTISYQLPVSNNVKLLIYNIKGQLVKTLIDDKNASGIHSIVWDGTDSLGNVVNSGVYFYKLSLNGITKSRKIILMR